MNLRQLMYFQSVAQTGSQTLASQAMGVSQPALGVQVRSLETEFGVELFTRKSRGMEMTDAGRELNRHVDTIMAQIEQAKLSMRQYRLDQPKNITIGVPPTPGKVLIPSLLKIWALKNNAPLVLHEGLSTDLVHQVLTGNLDYALCYDPPDTLELDRIPLFHEDLVLIGPPDLIRGTSDQVSFASLAELPVILDKQSQSARIQLDLIAQEVGVAFNVVMEVESVNLKRELIEALQAFSIVPFGLFAEDIKNGRFAAHEIVSPSVTRTLFLVNRSPVKHENHDCLVDSLMEILVQKIIDSHLNWREIEDEFKTNL